MKKKTYKAAIITFFSVLIVGCAALGITAVATKSSVDDNIICNGVYIETVDVGGMTPEEAKTVLDKYIETKENREVIINVAGKKVKTNLSELGYTCDDNDYIEQALQVGKTGNLIKRYKELKDIEEEKLVYDLNFTLDEAKVKNLVEEKCTKFDVAAVNSELTRENGQFIITDDVVGKKMVADETIAKILTTINETEEQESITIDAVVMEDIPKYTKESLAKVDDVLSTFSTTYGDSSNSRATNLASGARHINGTVLYPGEEMSCYEKLNPFTAENGYMPAGAYSQGKVIDSIGGGVCQVTSTLYNAVLLAELEIVERFPHSMTVGYVQPSSDAAIAGTYKDLKFKNNLESPVYIEATTIGRTITFTIYGDEQRDVSRRTVKYVSEVLERMNPPKEVVTEDPSLPTTYRRVTQSAHSGMRARLFKVVYIDGVETERTQVNTSAYSAAPAYVIVGTKEAEKPDDEKDKDGEKDDEKDKDGEKDDEKGNDKNKDDKDTGKTEKPKKDPVVSDDIPAEDEPISGGVEDSLE